MFLSYYKLKLNPFKISVDPDFLWLGEKHKEALATLKYGLYNNKGFLLLTGDVGTGKTTLINALINSLDKDILVAVISNPILSKKDFFNFIAHLFGSNETFKSKGDFIVHFSLFLNNVYHANKKVLLIIDEAQNLTSELLEEIRLLSNIEKQHIKLINTFFVGQYEFNDLLHKEENKALRQRLALNYHIDPLDSAETDKYITHRLKVAGTRERLFDKNAVSAIYKYSGGYPRQINIICDLALLTGFVNEKKIINKKIIKECVKDLKIPQKTIKKNRIFDSFLGKIPGKWLFNMGKPKPANKVCRKKRDQMPSSKKKGDTEKKDSDTNRIIDYNIDKENSKINSDNKPEKNKGFPFNFWYFLLLCLSVIIACGIYFYFYEANQNISELTKTTQFYHDNIKNQNNQKTPDKPSDNQSRFNISNELTKQETTEKNLSEHLIEPITDLPTNRTSDKEN